MKFLIGFMRGVGGVLIGTGIIRLTISLILKADQENLHQRIRDLLKENEMLRERLGPRGLEVVMIGDCGHYVNEALKAEIESLRVQLSTEKEITANLVWAAEQRVDGTQ